jgi:hypothetical protein
MTDFHDLGDSAMDAQSGAVWADLKSRGAELYREFCRLPIGAHSPNLQFVLQHFRKSSLRGKYVLVALEPHRRWQLARLTGVRGDCVRVNEDVVFIKIEDAERHVFRLRWLEMTGQELAVDEEHA